MPVWLCARFTFAVFRELFPEQKSACFARERGLTIGCRGAGAVLLSPMTGLLAGPAPPGACSVRLTAAAHEGPPRTYPHVDPAVRRTTYG